MPTLGVIPRFISSCHQDIEIILHLWCDIFDTQPYYDNKSLIASFGSDLYQGQQLLWACIIKHYWLPYYVQSWSWADILRSYLICIKDRQLLHWYYIYLWDHTRGIGLISQQLPLAESWSQLTDDHISLHTTIIIDFLPLALFVTLCPLSLEQSVCP